MEVAAKQRRVALELWGELRESVVRHRLLTFASAVSFRALVALVPLILLGLGVLGALGQESVWTNSIAPAIEHHVTALVFRVWVSDVSNFKTGIGFLTAFLVLGAYIYLSVLVFVLGVQLDELLRKKEEG